MPDKVVLEIRYVGMYEWSCDMCRWGEIANYDGDVVREHVRKHMLVYHGVSVDVIKTSGSLE